MWVIFVRHDNTLQINSRISGTTEHPVAPEALSTFLDENLSHFEILANEDPEYQELEDLQNGKSLIS